MQRFLFRISTLCLLCALPAYAQFGIFKPSKPSNVPTPNNPLAGNASKQPDKELFEKAMVAMKKGKFDVARLDLQTLRYTRTNSSVKTFRQDRIWADTIDAKSRRALAGLRKRWTVSIQPSNSSSEMTTTARPPCRVT